MNDQANTPATTAAQQMAMHPIDYTPLPDWGDGPDGRRVHIAGDVRLPAQYTEWQADACTHPRVVILRFVNAGGATMHQYCCKDCGLAPTRWIKREEAERQGIAVDFTKDQAASISNRYRSERKARLDGIVAAAAERMQPIIRAYHDDYLRSPQWQRRRSKVMTRAGHLCEGCLTNPALDVHHTTYAHFGNEFAFELIALCRACHERMHEAEAAE